MQSPEAYGSCRVFVCISAESFPELVLCVRRNLKKALKHAMQALTQYYLEMKLVDLGLVALLWSYGVIYVWLLTLTTVFCCLESVEEQVRDTKCALRNLTHSKVCFTQFNALVLAGDMFWAIQLVGGHVIK